MKNIMITSNTHTKITYNHSKSNQSLKLYIAHKALNFQ